MLGENVERLRWGDDGFDEAGAPEFEESGCFEEGFFAGGEKEAVSAGFLATSGPA